MNDPPQPSPPPVVGYALPPQATRSQLSFGEYAFLAAWSLLVLIIVAVPMTQVVRYKKVFDDFKLKLPAPTRLTLMASDFLTSVGAHYWIWIIPFVLPFALARLRPQTRKRLLTLAGLASILLAILIALAVFMPMLALVEGITGSGQK